MNTINERIQYIIDHWFSGNKSRFAQSVGISPAIVDSITGKRQSAPSFQILQKIATINEVSLDWLIFGSDSPRAKEPLSFEYGLGDTEVKTSQQSITKNKPRDDNFTFQMISSYIETLKEQIQQKDAQIKDLMDLLKNR